MTTDVTAPAAPAADVPAPAPAATPDASAAPAAAPAAAPVFESLIHDAPAGDTTAPAAPAPDASKPADDPFAALLGQVPEKFHVKDGDKLDPAASLAKALEHRAHLEKRLGAGDLPPKTAAEYTFTPPEELKDFEFKGERINEFREGALKLGFTQSQYEFALQNYLQAVPDLMDGAAKLSAAEARAELQKVWQSPADLESGIANAQRGLRGLPPELVDATRELGTNPTFLRAMAHFGAQMREDRPPGGDGTGASKPAGDGNALMRHPAYTDPKHPEHQTISKQVAEFFAKAHGTTPL